MPRDAVSRTANVGTVGTNGLRKMNAYVYNLWLCIIVLWRSILLFSRLFIKETGDNRLFCGR